MCKRFMCDTDAPVVQTAAGRLRGFLFEDIYRFYGVKYADAKRFQPPTPVAPWEGEKEAFGYGFVCPMLTRDTPGIGEIRTPHRYWPQDEDCQYLNIWTPSLDPDAKRPVMVWLHGGGFSAGSSIEQAAYDGAALSRWGDVVVVTLNHRLNILGYLDLSTFDEKYKNSGNAGQADIVAALQWVQENIAAFGGDANNVTLFGQSGGGCKITALLQCPSADGLFHKAIIQSGVIQDIPGSLMKAGFYSSGCSGETIVRAMMHELGIADVHQLETAPYAALAGAFNKVAPALAQAGEYTGCAPIANGYITGDPAETGFREHALRIPLIIGTVLNEVFAYRQTDNAAMAADARGVMASRFGEANVDELKALYEKAYPGKPLRDLVDLDIRFRLPTRDYILTRAEQGGAPVYSYQFALDFDLNGGSGPWHCCEIAYVFHNADITPVANIEGVSDRFQDLICGAWVNFARYGNPNHVGLPVWPASAAGDEACMIFDRECIVRHNHDHTLIERIAAISDTTQAMGIKIEH